MFQRFRKIKNFVGNSSITFYKNILDLYRQIYAKKFINENASKNETQ